MGEAAAENNMTIFGDAADVVFGSLADAAGETAVYSHGTQAVSLQVVISPKDYELVDAAGNLIQRRSFDLLVSGDDVVDVHRGDKFTVGERVFEAFDISGQCCFRHLDSDGKVLRVHTKQLT